MDSHDKKRLIFRKIRAERTHRRGKLNRLRTRKPERVHYEKIDPDPYAKRIARRVAAAPARQSNPVGPASRTTQARWRRRLEYPHLAVPRAQGSNAGRRFCRAFGRNYPVTLESFTRTIAMYHQIHTYTELRQQIHGDLRIQHPEWIQSNGESPMCDSYEARLTKMLDTLTRRGTNGSIIPPHRALEPAVTGS
jgi:hypothetical protein